MLKFLRKYNKIILVVFGTLLMVVFLVPQAIQQFGANRRSRVVMRIDGKGVSAGEMMDAQAEYRALDRLLTTNRLLGLLGIQDPEHWLLLKREAERRGFVAGPQDGQAFTTELATQAAQAQFQTDRVLVGFNPIPIDQYLTAYTQQIEDNRTLVGASVRLTQDEVDLALGRLRGVLRMFGEYGRIAKLSRNRIVAEARRGGDSARIDFTLVPARAVIDEIPEPSDEQLEAHFNDFVEMRPGEGEYGIGYLLPPRARLEWLVVDRRAIEQDVTPDRVEVQKRLRREMQESGEDWDEQRRELARDRIERTLVRETTDRVLEEIDRQVAAEIARVTQTFDVDDDGYLILPDGWREQAPRLEDVRDRLAERVESELGIRIDPPTVTIRDAEFLDRAQLTALAGVGRASLTVGDRRLTLPDFALGVREVDPESDIGAQVGVIYRSPLEDTAGNRYYFTVLDARPESPPDSWEDIRETVSENARRVAAYELLLERQDEYLERARSGGLTAIALPIEGRDDGAPDVLMNVRISEDNADPVLRGLRANEQARKAIMDLARENDPTTELSDSLASERFIVTPLPSELGLGVSEIESYTPFTREQFMSNVNAIATSLRRNVTQREDGMPPFAKDVLFERHNVEFVGSALPGEAEDENAGSPDEEDQSA